MIFDLSRRVNREPPACRERPVFKIGDPSAGNDDPAAGSGNPLAGNADPAARNADPVAGNADPVAGNAVPAARSADPVAGNAVPAAGSAVPVAGNAVPAAGSADPVAGNADPSGRKRLRGAFLPPGEQDGLFGREGNALPENRYVSGLGAFSIHDSQNPASVGSDARFHDRHPRPLKRADRRLADWVDEQRREVMRLAVRFERRMGPAPAGEQRIGRKDK